MIDVPVSNQVPAFTITDTKIYVPIVTSSIQDNAKLFQQLESGFKRIMNWNKYKIKSNSTGTELTFILLD